MLKQLDEVQHFCPSCKYDSIMLRRILECQSKTSRNLKYMLSFDKSMKCKTLNQNIKKNCKKIQVQALSGMQKVKQEQFMEQALLSKKSAESLKFAKEHLDVTQHYCLNILWTDSKFKCLWGGTPNTINIQHTMLSYSNLTELWRRSWRWVCYVSTMTSCYHRQKN